MPKGESDFWQLPGFDQYIIKLYYSILLVTGNDVMPSQQNEFKFCSLILIIGAFLDLHPDRASWLRSFLLGINSRRCLRVELVQIVFRILLPVLQLSGSQLSSSRMPMWQTITPSPDMW